MKINKMFVEKIYKILKLILIQCKIDLREITEVA